MFETAVAAGVRAALIWMPDGPDPMGPRQCCPVCFQRYRVMVLDGPLGGLPHDVAHAVVTTVDALIGAVVVTGSAPLPIDSGARRSARQAAAAGGLLMVALEEFGAAHAQLADLRRRVTEPAVVQYIEQHRSDDEPWTGS